MSNTKGLDELFADYPLARERVRLAALAFLVGAVEGAQGAPDPALALEGLGVLATEIRRRVFPATGAATAPAGAAAEADRDTAPR